jgi:HSP20 family protein
MLRRLPMVALIRWNPEGGMDLRPFGSPLGWLDEFEEMAASAFETSLIPRLDMFEEGKELVVKAELPGIRKQDLDVRIDGDMLTIKAEKKAKKEAKEATHYARERSYGRYVRYMTLPFRVEGEKISATLKKGLLEIRMPKAEVPEPKKIEIKTK